VRDEQAKRLRILSGACGIAESALVLDPTKADLSVAVDKETMVPTPEDASTVAPPRPDGKAPMKGAEGKAPPAKVPEARPAARPEAKPGEAKGTTGGVGK